MALKGPTQLFGPRPSTLGFQPSPTNYFNNPLYKSPAEQLSSNPFSSNKFVEVAGVYKTSQPFANAPLNTPSPVLQDSISIVKQREAAKAAELVKEQEKLAQQQKEADFLRQQQQEQKEQQMLLTYAQDQETAAGLESTKNIALQRQLVDQYLADQAEKDRLAAEAEAAAALKLRDDEAARLAAEKLRLQAELDEAQNRLNKTGKESEASRIAGLRISKAVAYRNKQIEDQAKQSASVLTNVGAGNKTGINRPGISITKINPGIVIGGYGGTKAGRVNPTSLNI